MEFQLFLHFLFGVTDRESHISIIIIIIIIMQYPNKNIRVMVYKENDTLNCIKGYKHHFLKAISHIVKNNMLIIKLISMLFLFV